LRVPGGCKPPWVGGETNRGRFRLGRPLEESGTLGATGLSLTDFLHTRA
jgi:hypothetical protein